MKLAYPFRLCKAFASTCIKQIKIEHVLLICILVIGIFLRWYKIEHNFNFTAEVGDNLLDIKNAFIQKYIPLKGPPTSHPWLSFGPLFYWIYGPILILAHFNPLSHAYFSLVIGILILVANYFFIKRLFSSTVAVISTFLLAISPLYIMTTAL